MVMVMIRLFRSAPHYELFALTVGNRFADVSQVDMKRKDRPFFNHTDLTTDALSLMAYLLCSIKHICPKNKS